MNRLEEYVSIYVGERVTSAPGVEDIEIAWVRVMDWLAKKADTNALPPRFNIIELSVLSGIVAYLDEVGLSGDQII